ncbi:MAG: hypothetical protein AAF939_00400 [Planctomycetota bacterium]
METTKRCKKEQRQNLALVSKQKKSANLVTQNFSVNRLFVLFFCLIFLGFVGCGSSEPPSLEDPPAANTADLPAGQEGIMHDER